MEKTAIIYRITNNINNATYIRQTSLSLEERFNYHKKHTKGNSNYLIHVAMIEFEIENFSIEQIDYTFYRHRYIKKIVG